MWSSDGARKHRSLPDQVPDGAEHNSGSTEESTGGGLVANGIAPVPDKLAIVHSTAINSSICWVSTTKQSHVMGWFCFKAKSMAASAHLR